MEILILTVLLLVNGVFAMYEIALVSSSKSRLEALAQKGSSTARTVLHVLEEPEKMLSAIQVGITLIGIVSGAYGGVALADDVKPFFEGFPAMAPYAGQLALASVISIITYFSLVVGELVPKSVALSAPERIVLALTPFMLVLTRIAYPFVWLLSVSTKGVNRLIGVKASDERAMTEEELKFLLQQSSDSGVIDQQESDLIKEVFRFSDKRASEIMTHRKDVVYLTPDMSVETILDILRREPYSKYPVCEESMDDVMGIVTVKDLLLAGRSEHGFDLRELASPPLLIPENVSAGKALEHFRNKKNGFGIIIDEYGSVQGILTLHDLAETLLGDIPEETEEIETEIVRRADGSWLVDGSMNIWDFLEEAGMGDAEDLEEGDFNTVGGFAMFKLDKVPTEGDLFAYRNLKFEIVDMDKSRVDKLLVTRTDPDE